MLPEFDVRLIDGRVELTPESSLADSANDAICLGVTVVTGRPILDALRASRAAKRRNPRLPVIWGGPHPTLLPEQCLASPLVDVCVSGQGEETFREIALRLARGQNIDDVAGIAFKRDGAVVRNPPRGFHDVNAFPRVNFDLVSMEKYFAYLGARRLDYCSSQEFPAEPRPGAAPVGPGRRWSGLAADRVVSEVADHARRYRLDRVSFNDGNFFADPSRTEAIARGLIEQRAGLSWRGTGHADLLSAMSSEQFALMRESGCSKVHVGAEGGSRGVLENTAKDLGAGKVLETAEKLKNAGIGARFSFIVGVPDEPPASLAETYRTVKALRRINGAFETPIHFFSPYPGVVSDRRSGLGFETPKDLEAWARLELADSIGDWIPDAVRKFVPRYNFYMQHAFAPVDRGIGKRVARWCARVRVRFDFYRFDFERRLVDLSKRVRTGTVVRRGPPLTEE